MRTLDVIVRVVAAESIVVIANLGNVTASLVCRDKEAPQAEVLSQILASSLTSLLVEFEPAVVGRTAVTAILLALIPALTAKLHAVVAEQLVELGSKLPVISGTMVVQPEVVVHTQGY